MLRFISYSMLLIIFPLFSQALPLERLDRGVVAVRQADGRVFVSWRLLQEDPSTVAFDVYRLSEGQAPVKLNRTPIDRVTWLVDSLNVPATATTYCVCKGAFQPTAGNCFRLAAAPLLTPSSTATNQSPLAAPQITSAAAPYLSIPLQRPQPGEVDGRTYSYSANDASVGDLDGDGRYEIILKWEPSLTRNPPQPGLTGLQLLDAYTLDGTLLWRINLGQNIRAGAAYTQFLVYDLDGDGKAEMICKTADGTVDGTGTVLGEADIDWRTLDPSSLFYGKVVNGPEYLTVFEGTTGKALASADYIPTRYPLDGWGGWGGNGGNDTTGGRPDRFTAGIAYLDGKLPSAVFVRGWYGRTVVAAWDFRDGILSSRWVFDSKDGSHPYSGQGNHSVTVADVDDDGKDEFCVGAMTLDDDGKGLYTTGLRHGDALHLADIDPSRPGYEVFGVHENEGKSLALNTPGVALFDAATGEILFSLGPGVDVGRGVAADIDPTHPGFENWGGPGGLRDAKGTTISEKTPSSTNFVVWWDGDLTRELLDKNRIDKWDWTTATTSNLLTAEGSVSNNGTKATPCLSADILGDWREEVIWRSADNSELRLYTTTHPTDYRLPTLMHDRIYRLGVAWQNVGYNQPPHLGRSLEQPPAGTNDGTDQHAGAGRSVPATLTLSDDFSQGLANWVIENNSDSTIVTVDTNVVDIVAPKGFTMWYKQPLEGDAVIRYEAYVVGEGGPYDRVSDLNCFWMAQDPAFPDDFFARTKWRNGVFGRYYSLRMYYVGYGGNHNTTTRFRKYDGDYEAFQKNTQRPDIIAEFTDPDHLITPNRWYTIEIRMEGKQVTYLMDGKPVFDHTDDAPYRNGYFGIRTTQNHVRVKNVTISQTPAQKR